MRLAADGRWVPVLDEPAGESEAEAPTPAEPERNDAPGDDAP